MKMRSPTVLFTGGIGNQLFQFVFMLYLKQTHGLDEISYNTSTYRYQPTHSGFQADIIFDFSQFNEDKTDYCSLKNRLVRRVTREHRWAAPFSPFVHERYYAGNNVQKIYEGFWQKTRYYDAVKELLPTYTKDIVGILPENEILKKMQKTDSVFVHVRRGDYVNNPTYVDLTQGDYYQKAIRFMKEHLGDAEFFVFSDDIVWCKDYFKEEPNLTFVEYEGQSAINDLVLMSQCSHAIMANSSYSWWGAALGKKEMVLHSPFYFRRHGVEGLYPEEWVEIKHCL